MRVLHFHLGVFSLLDLVFFIFFIFIFFTFSPEHILYIHFVVELFLIIVLYDCRSKTIIKIYRFDLFFFFFITVFLRLLAKLSFVFLMEKITLIVFYLLHLGSLDDYFYLTLGEYFCFVSFDFHN